MNLLIGNDFTQVNLNQSTEDSFHTFSKFVFDSIERSPLYIPTQFQLRDALSLFKDKVLN